MCTIPQIFVDIDDLTNCIVLKTTLTTSKLGTFSPSFVLSINYFVLPNNFIVLGVCNYSLHLSFILDTNLLLILLM